MRRNREWWDEVKASVEEKRNALGVWLQHHVKGTRSAEIGQREW